MSEADLQRQRRLNELTADTSYDTRTCPQLRRANNRFELNKNCNHQTTHKLSDGKPVKSIEAWGDCCDELDILDGKPPRSSLKTARVPTHKPQPKPQSKPTSTSAKSAPSKKEWKGWGNVKPKTDKPQSDVNEEKLARIKQQYEADKAEEARQQQLRENQELLDELGVSTKTPAERAREALAAKQKKDEAFWKLVDESVPARDAAKPTLDLSSMTVVRDQKTRDAIKQGLQLEHDNFDVGMLGDGTYMVSDNETKKVYRAGKRKTRKSHKAKGKSHKAKGKSHKAKGKSHKAKGKSHKAKGKSHKAKGKSHKAKGKRKTRKH
jgi:hypothetical protein